MKKFTDQSTATDIEKARRFLISLIDVQDYSYFYYDGFPKHEEIANDAKATLEVIRQLQEKIGVPT